MVFWGRDTCKYAAVTVVYVRAYKVHIIIIIIIVTITNVVELYDANPEAGT